MDKMTEKAFEWCCQVHTECGECIFTTKNICSAVNVTQYKARKIIKELSENGFVKKVSIGRPALMSYGEYAELECEAMPPFNGYELQRKAFETEVYKQSEIKEKESWEKFKLELDGE